MMGRLHVRLSVIIPRTKASNGRCLENGQMPICPYQTPNPSDQEQSWHSSLSNHSLLVGVLSVTLHVISKRHSPSFVIGMRSVVGMPKVMGL
jgi:hypothetical protein